ncbi:hypothetical protein IAS59_006572 [Cryptococcus gattii]
MTHRPFNVGDPRLPFCTHGHSCRGCGGKCAAYGCELNLHSHALLSSSHIKLHPPKWYVKLLPRFTLLSSHPTSRKHKEE